METLLLVKRVKNAIQIDESDYRSQKVLGKGYPIIKTPTSEEKKI